MYKIIAVLLICIIISTNAQNQMNKEEVLKPPQHNNQNNSTSTVDNTVEEKPKVENEPNNEEFNLTYEMEKAYLELQKTWNSAFGDSTTSNDTVTNTISSPINSTKPIEEIKISDELLEAKKKDEDREYQEKLKWEEQVKNFTFSNLLTFLIKSGEDESFYEEITQPIIIRFAFMINHPTKKIDFTFSGPQKNGKKGVIVGVNNKNYFFYEHKANIAGLYTFSINNHKHKENAKITFALNTDKVEEKTIDTQNLDALSKRLNDIDNKMGELRMKANLVVKKVEGHNKSIIKHNKSIVIFSIIEVVTMVIIFIFQSFYLTKLVSKV